MVNPLDERAIHTYAHSKVRASRWIVLLSVPLLLLSMLFVSMRDWTVAFAATEYTVGSCTGVADPYPTIQDAVNDAVSGTIINICPGIYVESVNLSTMKEMGNIALRNTPDVAGTVLITSEIGSSIYITPGENFVGDITIVGIDVTSIHDAGIDFGSYVEEPVFEDRSVHGSVLISDVVAESNGAVGTYIIAGGAVAVENSQFHENYLAGLVIEFDFDLIFDLAIYPEIDPIIHVHGVTANNNRDLGIYIDGLSTVEVYDTEANENGVIGQIGFDEGTGIEIYSYNYELCAVGTQDEELPYVELDNVTANGNLGGWGTYIETMFDVYAFDSEFIGNPYDGLAAYAGDGCFYSIIQVTHSYAYGNGWGYPNLDPVGEIDTQSVDDGFGGFRLESEGDIWIDEGTVAEANYHFGYCLAGDWDTRVENALAINNGGDGFSYRFDGCSPYRRIGSESRSKAKAAFATVGVATADKVTVEPALIDFLQETYVISNSSAISNAGVGFDVQDAHLVVTYTNISALRNITGVAFNDLRNRPQYDERVFGCAITGQGGCGGEDPDGGPTTIVDSLIQSNTNYGVVYGQLFYEYKEIEEGSIQGIDALTSTNYISSSIVCENGDGLGAHQYAVPTYYNPFNAQGLPLQNHLLWVDARGNWWGALDGPSGAGPGSGDSIVIQAYNAPTNTVTVDFAPWIDTIHASAVPSPTLVSIPVALAYQFRDAGLAYYLQNGVGDPNNGPLFHLVATNGTINGDVDKFIVNTLIESSATPSEPGILRVDLQGPCGLSPTLEVPVVVPDIDIEKSPDVQGVAAGDTATFTVTVTNEGNVPLTDITVSDPLVNACSRPISNLAIGASETYTCSTAVGTNLVNTINVEGYAEIEGSAAGDKVTDSDTAQVVIASFSFIKSVFVNGYREEIANGEFNPSECALASSITVPVSTTVKYCYTIINTGDYTLSTHSLVDDHLGTIFSNFPAEIGPGQRFTTTDAGVVVTSTLTVSTTNIATWTAQIAAPTVDVGTAAVQATLPVVANALAEVLISSPTTDQDSDGIPDNVEGSGDTNTNGIPDFLDPAGPTAEEPTAPPQQGETMYLPSLGNE